MNRDITMDIHIDPSADDIHVHITAPAMDQQVQWIEHVLRAPAPRRVVARKGNDVTLLNYDDVMRFYTKDKGVWAHTPTGHWQIKERMKDLEQKLQAEDFVRISQGEIVNVAYVDRFDMSGAGTIVVRMKDGTRCFVSRRSITTFKKKLGI